MVAPLGRVPSLEEEELALERKFTPLVQLVITPGVPVVLVVPLVVPLVAPETLETVPVTLTVDNEYRAVNVTVPASLPIEVINGTVLTAENARITNNSKSGSVRVSGVEVTNGAYKVGDYNSFSGAKTIALKINGCSTEGPGKLGINTTAFPVIKAEESLALEYFAKISADAPNSENVNALNVVFTISIV